LAELERERPWFKHWPPGVPRELEVAPRPLYSPLDDTASRYPEETAMIFYGRRISYAQLRRWSMAFAGLLRSLGLSKGDRLGLLLPNSPQFALCYYGALRLGCVVVPFNPRYKAAEIVQQARDAELRAIVVMDQVFAEFGKARDGLGIEHVLLTHLVDYLPGMLRPFARLRGIRRLAFEGTLDMDARLEREDLFEGDASIKAEEDLAVILYTGGTTGTPKGAMLTHYNLLVNAAQTAAWGGLRPLKDITLAVLPFFHSYGMTAALNAPIMSAVPIVLLPRFEPVEVLKAIARYKPTLFPGVPAMYIALLNHPELKRYDLRSIRLCISGAAPLPVEVAKRWSQQTGGIIVEGYGLTEASPVTHCNPTHDASEVRYGSIGIPLPSTDATVVDPDEPSRGLGPREVGEVAIKGPQVMRGYWRRPEETAQVLKEGWLLTGDLGYYDEEGYFYIVDRKKDMINVGGFKALPREIEEVLYEHPGVKLAAVIGIRDERLGEVPKAFVVLKEEFEGRVTKEELLSLCSRRLAGYKVPREIEFRKELPMTLVGKVLRRALREQERQGPRPEGVTGEP
jgi:long-chain acyl-CoA synthetase